MFKNKIIQDKNKRLNYKKNEIKNKILKSFLKNFSVSDTIKIKFGQDLFFKKTNNSITKVRNRCLLTGRSRANSILFKISRIKLRELSGAYLLNGVYKSSW